MTLDDFAGIIDKFLEENHVQMLIDSPEGTQAVTIEENIGLGGTVQYFLLLQAMTTAVRNMAEIMKNIDAERFVDGLLRELREDMIAAIRDVQEDNHEDHD